MSMTFTYEQDVPGYTGPEVTLHVGENDGQVVIGVSAGSDNRVWALLEPEQAKSIITAINEAITRAEAKG